LLLVLVLVFAGDPVNAEILRLRRENDDLRAEVIDLQRRIQDMELAHCKEINKLLYRLLDASTAHQAAPMLPLSSLSRLSQVPLHHGGTTSTTESHAPIEHDDQFNSIITANSNGMTGLINAEDDPRAVEEYSRQFFLDDDLGADDAAPPTAFAPSSSSGPRCTTNVSSSSSSNPPQNTSQNATTSNPTSNGVSLTHALLLPPSSKRSPALTTEGNSSNQTLHNQRVSAW